MDNIVNVKSKWHYDANRVMDAVRKEEPKHILITYANDAGDVRVHSSDMTPAELLYLVQMTDYLAGAGALQGHNFYKYEPGTTEE